MANQPSKYSKFLIGAASAALVASAVAPVASAADFKDTKGNTHETAIDALSDAKVISGYPDGTFLPNKTLTRSDVVKMLGKWLVNSQGYEVPTDYKTKPRFADQTAKTNDELLKYSAVVKDNGVFNGLENGSLDATADITRENMALVLVRAFDTVHKTDLVAYVAEKEFNKDVTDRAAAKAEARPYIDVLDFFDITNPVAPKFNPKDTTTRGQFASFLYKTTNVEISDINAEVDSIKAINNTTVEVTFKTAIEDIKALDFAIEGLTVSNAVVKQTGGDKVVVLTTSAQEGDKAYTVTANGKKLGSFKGVSAVIPTSIKVTTPSLQGTLGKEVTVSAQVTVPEGQNKAGIPVTFNIVNSTSNQLNEKIEVVSYTNAEGVASYSYTRYYAHNDSVTAYATDKSSVFAKGTVYWAQSLALTEVTKESTLTNGAKKVYKVQASSEYANGYVNIAFAENLEVAPDKLVRTVNVTDVGLDSGKYPYQVTTGGIQTVQVKLDAKGEATFTLTGANASVTPIVFIDGHWETYNVWKNGNGKLEAQELQATAATVKFDLNHTLGLAVVAKGVQNAAAISETNQVKVKGDGGRTYVATVTDVKTGTVAPAGSQVNVVFPTGSISPDKDVFITYKNVAGTSVTTKVVADTVYTTTVAGAKGEASFKLTGKKDAYANPTVFVDNGAANQKLDKADLQTIGEAVYFVDAVVTKSEITILDKNLEEVTSVASSDYALFEYKSVDQNGFDYYIENGNYEVSYTIQPVFADVNVYNHNTGAFLGKVNKGTVGTFKALAVGGKALLRVESADTAIASNVTVSASSSQITLEDLPATVSFTKYSSTVVTDVATGVNLTADELTIKGVLYSYKDAAYKFGGSTITKEKFEEYIAENNATVSVTKDDAGKLTFNVLSVGTTITALVTAVNNATTDGQMANALQGYTGFSSLSLALQTEIADDLNDGTIYDVDTFTAAYNTAYDTGVITLINAVDTKATAANGTLNATTYGAFVKAVKDLPGSATVASQLGAIEDIAVQGLIVADLMTITATTDTTVITEIAKAITDAKAAVAAQEAVAPTNAALAALNHTDVNTKEELLAALKANNVVTTTKTNAEILGLDLTKVSTANEPAFETKFFAIKPVTFTELNTATKFNEAVKHVTDVTGPVVKTAVYDASGKTITITFDEAVTLTGGTLDNVDLTIGASTAVTGVKATETAGEIVITLAATGYGDAIDAGYSVDQTVTINAFKTSGDAAITVKDQSAKTNSYVAAPFKAVVTTP